MRATSIAALVLGLSHSVLAQDLSTALQKYPEVSTFQNLISQVPGGASSLLPSGLSPNSTKGVTVLVPSNEAFSTFLNATNTANVTDVPLDQLVNVLFYHIMYAKMTSANFSAPGGVIVPTLLKDEKYNNRSAGAELVNIYGADEAQGNVLFISKDPINPVKFRVRQQQDDSVALRGGMGQGGSINAIDGVWDLGYFQIVDIVLTPPAPCSNTIKSQDALQSLNTALTNAGLWDALDHTPNVTCLAPTNDAFSAAGNPETTLNSTDLTGALLFHTLPMPMYSPFLQDGMVLKSLGGADVTVTMVDGNIYFNDAKVISPNVLTNNGLIHVLDKVMSPNGTAPAATGTATTTSTAAGTSSTGGTRTSTTGAPGAGSSTGTASPNAAQPAVVGGGNAVGGLLAFLGAAAVLV
ncbi:fasciclin domain-containing protein [Coniochaeta sp. 2T2.1]|nr:fasciclin domain-containing protein [Coniochaeta sp. 2T2.1]